MTKKPAPKTTVKTAKSAASTSKSKVFDIAHPGQALPDSTSKPIIVSHKSVVRDPMVTAVPESKPEQEASAEPAIKKGRIEPLHDLSDSGPAISQPQATADSIEPENTPELEVPATESPAEEPLDITADNQEDTGGILSDATDESEKIDEEVEEEPAAPAEDAIPKESADGLPDEDEHDEESSLDDSEKSDEIEELAAQAAKKNAKEQEDQAAVKRQAEAEALIESRQFLVPINAVKKRRSMRRVLIVLLTINLIIIGGLAALDAGLVDVGIAPVTDYISD